MIALNWTPTTLDGHPVTLLQLHAVDTEPVIYWPLLAAPVIQAIKELIVHNWTPPTLAGHLVTLQLLHAVGTELVIYWPLLAALVQLLIQELTVPY